MKHFLLFSFLLATWWSAARAQTPLGQPTLDEQKATIWCAAIKFVYDDTGAPALKNTVKCGGSLKELENSIKADKQGVYSLLYQPLETKGTMYKGLGSDKSRLQKLKDEIINKLQSSPTRKGNQARMQAVQNLSASLTSYVENGTPPGDVSSSLNAEAAPDTSTNETTAAAPADASPEDNPNYAPPTPKGNRDGVMSSLFAPIAFITSLLGLVLFWLLRSSIKAVATRVDWYRKELEELKATSASNATVSGSSFSSKRLTPEQRTEVEKLVQQRVAEELERLGGDTVPFSVPGVETLGYGAEFEVSPAAESARQPENRAVAPDSNPGKAASSADPAPGAPTPQAPIVPDPDGVVSAPSAYSPPAASHLETPIPAGPPSASPRDEFDSLVPPVQLPAPDSYVSVAAASSALMYYYAKAPVNGGFSLYDLQEEPQHDSLYEITIQPQQPDVATFQVNPDPAVHAYAIQSAQHLLRDACQYQQPADSASYIINNEPGTLRKVGGAWQIEQKAAVHFE